MNETIRNAIKEMRRPYELALEATESLAKSHLSNWQDSILEGARKTATIGAIDINEIMGTSRLVQAAVDQIRGETLPDIAHSLHAELNRETILTEALTKHSSSFLSSFAELADKNIEIIESSKSDLLKLASGQNQLSAIAEGQSALASAMKQLDGSAFANIFKEFEVSRYAELLQPDFLKSLQDQEGYVDDDTLFIDTKNEIINNLSSGVDLKLWSKKAIKIFFAVYFMLGFINTIMDFHKNMNNLIDSTQTIKTGEQVNSLVIEASQKFNPEDLIDYRIAKGDNLNLRERPNKMSEIIHELPIGKILYIIDDSQPYWLKVEVEIEGEALEGWVSKRFTTKFQ